LIATNIFVSGKGIITIDGKDILIKENDVMQSPHDESHGFTNNGDEKSNIMKIKCTKHQFIKTHFPLDIQPFIC
jgi:mannose-6-phosphate isomerase-like protein (cupin superfamily)